MTNLETAPTETVSGGGRRDGDGAEVLRPRDVPLGGLRAMTVRRTLPQRSRSLIGAWCFVDHYGPDDVAATGGMRVPPHPHTGLQTVSWLFSGEVEHRDSLGTHAVVRPGELNLMTAGHGISHSEDSTDAVDVLHGVQLWVALPGAHRATAPDFVHHVPVPLALPDGEVRVFLGTLAGSTSPVGTFSPLLGAEVRLGPGAEHTFDVDPTFEHGVLVDTGEVDVDGVRGVRAELVHRPTGAATLTLRAGGDGARVVLLGGEPLGEQIVMWWNFIGRDHAEVVRARAEWQAQIGADDAAVAAVGDPADGDTGAADLADTPSVPDDQVRSGGAARPSGATTRFGTVEGHPHAPLPAPPLPEVGLRPRG